MIRLTRALGGTVVTVEGRHVGRVRDLTVEFGEPHPQVDHVVIDVAGRNGPPVLAPWSVIGSFADRRFVVLEDWDRSPAEPDAMQSPTALLLGRDVLDTQVVDVAGRRVGRVGDVLTTRRDDGALEVVAAELGARPVLRRIVPGVRAFHDPGVVVDWADLHLTSDRGHLVQLGSASAAMHRLDADGLALLLTELNLDDATDVVERVGVRRTAAALARAERDVATRILIALEPARARDIVDAMPLPVREPIVESVRRRAAHPRRRFSRFDGWRRHRSRHPARDGGRP